MDAFRRRSSVCGVSRFPVRERRILLAGTVLFSIGTLERGGLRHAQAQPRNDFGMLAGTGEQPNWRFCHKCFGMFYDGDPQGRKGRCPAGDAHVAHGLNFVLHYDHTRRQPLPGRDSQYEWRFCSKCSGMFFAGTGGNPLGQCPVVVRTRDFVDSKHVPYGFIFGLPHDHPGNAGQPDWRFCHKCFGLFYDDPRNANKGRCPADNRGHVRASNSFNFQLPFTNGAAAAPTPPPHPPTIGAILDSGQAVRITGSGFLVNAPITVKVVNEQIREALIVSIGGSPIKADGRGNLAISLFGLCQTSRQLKVSATDGRRVPPSVDLTGNLWSNTVSLSCG